MLPKDPSHVDEVWEEVNHKALSEIIESCAFFPQGCVNSFLMVELSCTIQLEQDFTVGRTTVVYRSLTS